MRIARVRKPHGGLGWVGAADGDDWRVIPNPFQAPAAPVGPVVTIAEFLPPVLPTSQLIGLTRTPNEARPIQAWLKNPRGITGHQRPIPARAWTGRVHVEGEIAAVIGRPSRDTSPDSVIDNVLGWVVADDVTDADQAAIDPRVFQAKHAAGYTPLGPWIETDPGNVDDLAVTVSLDGTPVATTSSSSFHEPMREALAYVARWIDLEPGDVVMTGWAGPSIPITAGDVVTIECAGIGRLVNPVR